MQRISAWVPFSLGGIALTGCTAGGSGTGDAPQGEVSAAAVSSTTPADGAGNIPLEAALRAAFNLPMDPASITASSFTLHENSAAGSQVAASVGHDAVSQSATLAPSSSLASNTGYLATLTAEVRDAAGKPLAAPFGWPSRPPTPFRPRSSI